MRRRRKRYKNTTIAGQSIAVSARAWRRVSRSA
jgi:hypothetical protein